MPISDRQFLDRAGSCANSPVNVQLRAREQTVQ